MMKLDKNLKIFLTFLLIYSLFVHWVGWNEETRYLLSKAIFFENRFEIDSYYNLTGDRAFYNGHYYSDKPPGIALITSFLQILGNRNEGTIFVPYKLNQAVIFTPAYLASIELIKRVLFIILTSSVFGALIILLFAKIFSGGKSILFLIILFGFSSLLLPYSTTLAGPIFAAFLLLLSCILMLRDHRPFLSGVLAGMAPLFEYLSIFFLPSSLILFYKKKERFIRFIPGVILGLLPTFVYNYTIFGNPFNFPFFFVDHTIWLGAQINYKNWPTNLLELLILPYRGLFFYYPFLALAILGIKALLQDKKLRNFGLFLISFFSSLTIFSAVFLYTTGGSSFSVRYLVVSIPLLLLSFLLVFQRIFQNKIIFSIFVFLNLLSILFNFSSFSAAWEGPIYVVKDKELLDIPYYANPLFEYYLPSFLESGPRSRILEYLLVGEIPDIRDFKPMLIKEMKLFTIEPFGILTIQVPFLIVPVLLLIALLIWWKELSKLRILNLRLNIFLLLIIFLLFLSRLKITQIAFDKNWHPSLPTETSRYLQKEASVFIFSPEEKEVFINISIDSYRNKTLFLYLNNNLLNSYHAASSILEQVKLKKGENELRFIANDCEIPAYTENSSDYRCLSIVIKNISLLSKDQIDSIIFGSNWYSEEKYKNQTFRYFSQNATILIPFSGTFKINLTIQPYNSPKTLEIYVNDKLLGSYKMGMHYNLLTPTILLEKPLNIIRLKSKEGCEIPAYIENSSDYRCLSFSLWNISFINSEELLRKNFTILYGFNFYEQEKEGRWMSDNGIIYLINNSQLSKVFITLESFKRNRTLYVLLQNRSYVFEIPANERKIVSFPIFPENETEIKLIVFPTCEIAGEKDKRCLSIFIRELQVIGINELIKEKRDVEYIDFYPQEIWNNITFRWFSLSSKVNILVNDSNVYVLNFNAWTPPKQKRILKIFLNGKFVNSYSINENMQKINLPLFLKAGDNELVFVSDNCSYVYSDIRCLGVAISEIQKEDTNIQNIENFADGFYDLEKTYDSYFRWMSNQGEISLFSDQNVSIKLYAKIGWTYFSDRNLNITFNYKRIFTEKIDKNGIEFSIILNLSEGWNKLKFASSCDVPARIEFSKDKRCLSLSFTNLSFLPSGY
jgi:hypothetical protein